jgi:hypothetical protein
VHWQWFSTAASRRSLGSVSVPVWLTILSDQLPVSLGEPLPHQLADRKWAYLFATGSEESPPLYREPWSSRTHSVLIIVSDGYPEQRGKLPIYYSPVRRSQLKLLFRRIEELESRSTCMPNPRRQRSFWARIKLSIKFLKKWSGLDPVSYYIIRIFKTRPFIAERPNKFQRIGYNKPHHFWFEAMLHSVIYFLWVILISKNKKLQLIDAADSGFSVEAADNLSDSLSQSTALFK